jgi:hypothetical protein
VRLAFGAALAELAAPDFHERFSPLTGAALLAVDFAGASTRPDRGDLARVRRALGELPCPSVALIAESPQAPVDELVDAFDVVVSDRAALALLEASVGKNPLASQALVQLLRLNAALGIHEGLVAESLVYSTLQSGPEFAAWLASRTPRKPRATPLGPAVEVARRGRSLALELNRPEKRNAFSAEMRDALCEALQLAIADAGLRVELSGRGPAFCSGGDLDEFGSLPDPGRAHAIRSTRNAARLLAAVASRTECRIHGACVGAGIELPAFSARITAAPDCFAQLPEVGMGLVPGSGGTVSLPRRIGRQRTAWFALTGERIDAETALRIGLVDEVRAA